MNKQQIREIAEKAFRTHFNEIELFAIKVEPRLDHDGDRVVDVKFFCTDNYEKLDGDRLLRVQSEIFSKAWRQVEDDLGFPIVQYFEKATFEQHGRAAV